jgi:hypothetical protein
METWDDIANKLQARYPSARLENGRIELRLRVRGAERWVHVVACETHDRGAPQALIVATIGPAAGHQNLVAVHRALQRATTLFEYGGDLLLRILMPLDADEIERRIALMASEASQLQAKLLAMRPHRPLDCFAGYVD